MARPKVNPETIELYCENCKNKFIVKYKKKNQRFCSKICSATSPTTKQKNIDGVRKTFMKKYGCYPMQTDKTKSNLKLSMLQKYGVSHYSKHNDYNHKVKQTKLKKYGNENYTNTEKMKQTCLKRYGVDNAKKVKSINDIQIQSRLNNHYDYIVDVCQKNGLLFLTKKEDYNGYHFKNSYHFRCLKCNNEFEQHVYYVDELFCKDCNPDKIHTLESDIYDFIRMMLPSNTIIKKHDRSVLNKKEIDIYIPDKKIGIELNGLYWHSEKSGGITKSYHLNKTRTCNCKGISLIHIFENEWLQKQEIVKSVLRNILNDDKIKKINGRDCEIREISAFDKNIFLNENHLQGEDKSSVKIGLYYNNELVSVMTFIKKSRFEKHVEWELVRFCNKINTKIMGGTSKLFSYFINTYNPKSIVSYCDRRYFTGNVYEKLGFKFVSYTNPGYHYITNNYKNLINRMNFQKHKLSGILKNFDVNLSEWENMKNNGWDRIWDCGHSKYTFTNNI